MDENQIEGAAKDIGGNVKSAFGDVTGDTKTQASGAVDQVVGTAQRAYGNIKDKVSSSGAGSAMIDQSGRGERLPGRHGRRAPVDIAARCRRRWLRPGDARPPVTARTRADRPGPLRH